MYKSDEIDRICFTHINYEQKVPFLKALCIAVLLVFITVYLMTIYLQKKAVNDTKSKLDNNDEEE